MLRSIVITISSRALLKLFGHLTSVLLLILLIPGTIRAQSITADVLGTVTDNTGAIVPNAPVTIENMGTHERRNATSGLSGEYTFSLLPIGTYTLRINAPSFSLFEQSNITLSAGQRERID